MEDAHASRFDFTRSPSPTPPLPLRNPNHRYPHYLAQPRRSNTSAKLLPKPLFSSKFEAVELPSPPTELDLHFDIGTAHKLPDYPLRPASSTSYSQSYSQSSAPSSPTTSFRSLASHASSATSLSCSASDVPSEISSLSQRYSPLYPPPDAANNDTQPTIARRVLRRKTSPKKETLRSLRAKESDVCLQRAYEQQLDAYLSGTLFPRARWREGGIMGCVQEEE